MGTLFIWFFLVRIIPREQGMGTVLDKLTATSLVAAVQAFITGATAHHDMTTHITGRCITLHIL